MLKGIFTTSLVLGFVAFMPSAYAGKSPSAVPVTSTVHSLDANAAAYALGGDSAIAGSGDVYTTYTVSKTNDWLSSQILGSQDWQLDGLSSATRKFWVSFDSPAFGSPANPLPDGYQRGTFQTLCSNWGDTQALGGMTAGQAKSCGMILNFSVDNTSTLEYRIAFQEKNLQPDSSTQVSISCLAGGSDGKCNHWTIDPLPSGSVGTLVQITHSRNGQIVLKPMGYYNYNFHIDVVK